MEQSSPAARTRTFQHGPTCCNSMPFSWNCEKPLSIPSPILPTSATECAATWQCSCWTRCSSEPGEVAPGRSQPSEYWDDVISALKKISPNFLFLAEAYWDMEWELQQNGFDFCYDKRLYDRLEHDNAESVRLHLCADLAYQEKLLRFLENHDEPRAAAAFDPEKERAAAVVTSTLPGARMFHEGQFEGRKVRLPVFLGRRPRGACRYWTAGVLPHFARGY